MSTHLRVVSDPHLGAIAEVVDDQTAEVLGSCAVSPSAAHGTYVILDETHVFEHGHLLPPDLWAQAARHGDTMRGDGRS